MVSAPRIVVVVRLVGLLGLVAVAAAAAATASAYADGLDGVAASAAEPPRAQPITLPRALAAAARAPLSRSSQAREAAAAAEVHAAGGWPSTSIGVSTARRTTRLGLTASLPLPLFGTLGASTAAARADLEVSRAESAASLLDLRHQVARAWLELARVEAHATLTAAAAQREQELADVTQQRFDAGDAARAEVVAADAAARRARALAAAQADDIAGASAELATLLGWDPEAPLHAAGGLPALAAPPALSTLRAGLPRHPAATVASSAVVAAGARVGAARSETRPRLSLDLEAMLDDPTLPGNDYAVGVTLELPLWGHGSAAVRAAQAHQHAAALERERQLAAADGQLVAAYRRAQAALARAHALGDDVVPAQREAASLAHAAFSEGQTGLVVVLEAERALLEVELEALDAQADSALARSELEWAAGGPR